MKIAILGTGSLARLYGAIFQDDDPLMIGRQLGPYLLTDPNELVSRHNLRFQRWDDPSPDSWDVVFILVKWPAMPLVRNWLQRWAGDALIIPFMNGMGQEDALIPPLHPSQLSPAITTDAAFRNDDPMTGVWRVAVKNRGQAQLTQVAHPNELILRDRAQSLGLPWSWHDAEFMKVLRWKKLIANSIINPLSALSGQPNGDLPGLPIWRLAKPLCQEAETVARAYGVEVDRTLPWIVELATATGPNRSSMLQDVLLGKPTEIQAITGYIIEQAKKAGIPIPHHQALYQLIESL
ncbi:MAG: ketopantoate reductase family protein [Sulfobacillus sp.]